MPEPIEPNFTSLSVPGVNLEYGVRGAHAVSRDAAPALLMIGSPMEAEGFATLASYFTDRIVITYDPRGTGSSRRTNKDTESTPVQHADDLQRVINDAGAGPVDLFGSSGGAVNGLALVQRHPKLVRTLVAHEPVNHTVLGDREPVRSAFGDIQQTYHRAGYGAAMAKFIALTGEHGELGADYVIPDPGPAVFGLPDTDDGSRNDPMFGQNLAPSTGFEFDFQRLRSASTRIVLAAGVVSAETIAARSAAAIAATLGTEMVEFPSHHAGFLGGEYGQHGEPEAFAEKLRAVLGH